jgi:hypothetical protein
MGFILALEDDSYCALYFLRWIMRNFGDIWINDDILKYFCEDRSIRHILNLIIIDLYDMNDIIDIAFSIKIRFVV